MKKKNFFALSTWLATTMLYSMPIMNAAPPPQKGSLLNNESGPSSSGTSSESDSDNEPSNSSLSQDDSVDGQGNNENPDTSNNIAPAQETPNDASHVRIPGVSSGEALRRTASEGSHRERMPLQRTDSPRFYNLPPRTDSSEALRGTSSEESESNEDGMELQVTGIPRFDNPLDNSPPRIDSEVPRRMPLRRTISRTISTAPAAGTTRHFPADNIPANPLNMKPDDLKEPLNLDMNLGEELTEENTPNGISIKRRGEVLQNYTVSNDTLEYNTPVFVRTPVMISGNNPNERSKIKFNWLTISSATPVIFKDLDISGKIQATAKAKLIFINCNIRCDDPHSIGAESPLEIFAGSTAKFENCTFDRSPSANGRTIGAIIRGQGGPGSWFSPNMGTTMACFNRCKFDGIDIGVFSTQSPAVQLFDCEFSNCNNIALFMSEGVSSFVKNCKFTNMPGKSIFVKNSDTEIEDCESTGCGKGGITAVARSHVKLNRCNFTNLGSTAIRFLDSEMQISNCNTNDIKGNCLNIKSSNGCVRDCEFSSNEIYPLVAVTGPETSPLIERCSVDQRSEDPDTYASILSTEYSSPVFKNLFIKNYNKISPVILCKTLSHTTVDGIEFSKKSDKTPEIIASDSSKLDILMPDEPDFMDILMSEDEEKNFKSADFMDILMSEDEEENFKLPSSMDILMQEDEKEKKSDFEEESVQKFELPHFGGHLKAIGNSHGKVNFVHNQNVSEPKEFKWKEPHSFDERSSDSDSDEDFAEDESVDSLCCNNLNEDSFRPILPCGHVLNFCPKCKNRDTFSGFDSNKKVVCKNCGPIDLREENFRCKLCKHPLRDNNDLRRIYNESTCALCLDAPATNYFYPCGHKCLCTHCMRDYQKRNIGTLKCPFCNQDVTRFAIDISPEDKQVEKDK